MSHPAVVNGWAVAIRSSKKHRADPSGFRCNGKRAGAGQTNPSSRMPKFSEHGPLKNGELRSSSASLAENFRLTN